MTLTTTYYGLTGLTGSSSPSWNRLPFQYFFRLTIAYLKLREFAAKGDPKWNEETPEQRIKNQALRSSGLTSTAMEDFEKHEGTHILQSLDGFAIALNSDGRFLYVSETVSIYLGLSQVRPLSSVDT